MTSAKFDGDWVGTSGANDLCNTAATAAKLPGAGNYRAWLSDATDSPETKFFKSTLPYKRPDGTTIIATSWTELISNSLMAPIIQTEKKNTLSGANPNCNDFNNLVWTNTTAFGLNDSEAHCLGWTSNLNPVRAGVGNALEISNDWTEGCDLNCMSTARLYCFEQPPP